MSDDDMIRRGDTLAAVDANTPIPAGGPFSHTNSMRVVASDIRRAIAALPAVSAPDVAELTRERDTLAAHVNQARGLWSGLYKDANDLLARAEAAEARVAELEAKTNPVAYAMPFPPPEGYYTPSDDVLQNAASRDVLAERARQISDEGWTPEHDDQYTNNELAHAAACYAMLAGTRARSDYDQPALWPWKRDWWKPRDRRHDLVRAAALILAEIERMDRAILRNLGKDNG